MSALNDPRVLFAAERTLLAWGRTALSLVAFGFVIERSGILIEALGIPAGVSGDFIFWLGILFILLGSFAAGFSARQHIVFLRSLSPQELPPNYMLKMGVMMNILMAVLGFALAVLLTLSYFS